MKTQSLFPRLWRFRPSGGATVLLLALAWSSVAFSDEIHDAAEEGYVEKVRTMLKAHPEMVFSKDENGDTPLHIAALNGREDVAELLLANKADVNARDNKGDTPLHLAADTSKEVAKLMLAHGADVNSKDKNGDTPLHLAAENGPKDVVQFLLANGADVNAKDNGGVTPLHSAAIAGKKEVTEVLLANKAEVNAKDSVGATPLSWAEDWGHNDVAELLRQQGGYENIPIKERLLDILVPGFCYLIAVGVIYAVLFPIACILLPVARFRVPGIAKGLQPKKILLFFVLLLLTGDFFGCVWRAIIWRRFYLSSDYFGIDFLPFLPITQAKMMGYTLTQLNLIWLLFALATWGTTVVLCRLLSRSLKIL